MSGAGRVLFVDDDADVRAANRQALELEGLEVEAFADAASAFAALSRGFPGVVVSDLRMPGEDGHALFRRIRALDPDLPVILITGHADVAEAVGALHDGAYDFVSKPYAPERLLAPVRRALALRALTLENRRLRALAVRADAGDGLAGEAAPMRRLRDAVERVAGADVHVVVEGEGGSGRTTVARALHRLSRRRGRFVTVECAELEAAATEAEIFGAGPPAPGRPGRMEATHGGSLFLRDVERLSARAQARLLRALETGALGEGPNARPLDVRVLASTGASLAALAAAGGFRADLYHHLGGVTLRAPPLRERREDLDMLFGRFLFEAARRLRTPDPAVDPAARLRLQLHDWPGNLRELRAFAERCALGLDEPEPEGGSAPTLADRVAAFEGELLRDALRRTGGSVARALEITGLPRKTFYDKLARHNLRPEQFRPGRPPDRGGLVALGEPAPPRR